MLNNLITFIPFLIVHNSKIQFNYTRILEAVIIAVIAGTMAGYTTLKTLEVRIASIEQQVGKIYNDIYQPTIKGDYN